MYACNPLCGDALPIFFGVCRLPTAGALASSSLYGGQDGPGRVTCPARAADKGLVPP